MGIQKIRVKSKFITHEYLYCCTKILGSSFENAKDPILVDVFHLAVDMGHGNKLASSLYILKLLKELKQSFYCFNHLPGENKS